MASDESARFSREELLGGLSARRATTLLFAIENRTAHLVARSQQAVPIVLSERAVRQRERAFLEALAQGRDLPVQPTIQDLERYAPDWADLVPGRPGNAGRGRAPPGIEARLHPRRRAPVAIRPGPRLRSGPGTRTEACIGTSLETIYAPRLRPADRLRWAASRLSGRLDALPAFWLAFVVTLIIGAVNLALPIAVAGVGALPGIALIVASGSSTWSRSWRWSKSSPAAAASGTATRSSGRWSLTTSEPPPRRSSRQSLIAFSFGILLIFYIGISTTLADATIAPRRQPG